MFICTFFIAHIATNCTHLTTSLVTNATLLHLPYGLCPCTLRNNIYWLVCRLLREQKEFSRTCSMKNVLSFSKLRNGLETRPVYHRFHSQIIMYHGSFILKRASDSCCIPRSIYLLSLSPHTRFTPSSLMTSFSMRIA